MATEGAVKHPGMIIPTYKEKRKAKTRGPRSDEDARGRRLELRESVAGCRPPGCGINLNGITPLPLFLHLLLLHLLFHLPPFSLTAFFLVSLSRRNLL